MTYYFQRSGVAIKTYTDKIKTSESVEHGTPQDLFDFLNRSFGPFTLDAAATEENAKCDVYYTKEHNGLIQSWSGQKVFVNPPYGKGVVEQWLGKMKFEAIYGVEIVALLKSVTGNRWFHQLWKYVNVLGSIEKIDGEYKKRLLFSKPALHKKFSMGLYFIKGRLAFTNPGQGPDDKKTPALFDSVVLRFF